MRFLSDNKLVWLGLGSLAVGALAMASCSSQNVTTLFQAQFEGKPFLFQKVVKKTFEMIYYSTQLVFDDKPPIVLSLGDLSRSLPYEKTVYGDAPFHPLDVGSALKNYKNEKGQSLPERFHVVEYSVESANSK